MTRPTFSALAALVLAAGAAHAGERLAVRAGTVHLVEGGEVLTGGATLLVEDGRIVAVGTDVAVPPDAHLVDYGPEAVLVPGFVAADSALVREDASDRAADPGLRAIDGFDFYAEYPVALAQGITSAYLSPARTRLLSGQGAVVKLAGQDSARRVLASPAALQACISEEARSTPSFWEPPVPATVDVGIAPPLEQLPRTTMGAIVGLRELLEIAESGRDSELWGPGVARSLERFVEAGLPWRVTARDDDELRALLAFQQETGLPLVIHGADQAGALAEELAAAGVPVIVESAFRPNRPGVDHGKGPDAEWPTHDTAARLAAAGVPVSISTPSVDLLFAARLASRGGLPAEAALNAITLAPARAYGVDGRVGSLAPGKDADFVVLSGEPLGGGGVLATWVDGRLAWESAAGAAGPVVLEVDELHVGDGQVLRPGQVLMRDGVLVEVGSSVAHPPGARVVRGRAAMPGAIDALGHLGLEGSKKGQAPDFPMRRIVGPGDATDRRVARRGVTTVALVPRGDNSSGSPIVVYKPAASREDRQVVENLAALRIAWTDENVYESGEKVRELLQKGAEYRQEWLEYEAELARWRAGADDAESASAADEDSDGDEADEESEGDGEGDDDDDAGDDGDSKKIKKKKKGDEAPEPVTGVWLGTVQRAPLAGEHRLRLQVLDEGGPARGSLRCDALSETLVSLVGRVEDGVLRASGRGTEGRLVLEARVEDGELTGTVEIAEEEISFALERTSAEYPVARRPGPDLDDEEDSEEPPKGKPREPRADERLEPVRRAIEGRGALVIAVDGARDVLACVEACREVGVRPVLLGASGAEEVADRIAGHVAGILPGPRIVTQDPEEGARRTNVYAELQAAGIPVAFRSEAEEGAADLLDMAAYAISQGMSGVGALRALTSDVAAMYHVDDRVGRLATGLDADVLLLDGSPLDVSSSVVRVWVNGEEVL